MHPPNHLLIIDPQNDFCDLPATHAPTGCTPALPVAGAHADMLRLAAFIRAGGDRLAAITVTLDSHHRLHIAHPTFWQTGTGAGEEKGEGRPVAPFTAITAADVRAGRFMPRMAQALPRVLAYLDALEAGGRYTLMVWPVHCEIGSWGHAVHADVRAAYNAWETAHLRTVRKVAKGSNLWTEHYSAIEAEVPDAADPGTQRNTELLAALDTAGTLVVAGEASSHCVRATVEHLVRHLPTGRPERLVLLTDAMSPVAGFGAQHDAFLDEARGWGVQLSTCAALLARWAA